MIVILFLITGTIHITKNLSATNSSVALSGQAIYEQNKNAVGILLNVVKLRSLNPFDTFEIETPLGGGSAFYINNKGDILTCEHVIENPGIIYVPGEKDWMILVVVEQKFVFITADNKRYNANLLGYDMDLDTALLNVPDNRNFTVAKLGNSDLARRGDTVYALGAPYLLPQTFTKGIISAVDRNIYLSYIDGLLQTDCPTNPGNSGCPMLNSSGEVIGILEAGIFGANDLGFLIPINNVNIDAMRNGQAVYPKIGFEVIPENFPRDGSPNLDETAEANILKEIILDPEEYNQISLENLKAIAMASRENSAIVFIVRDSDCQMKMGDIVLFANGTPIKDGMDLRLYLRHKKVGDKITIEYLRAVNGKMIKGIMEIVLK